MSAKPVMMQSVSVAWRAALPLTASAAWCLACASPSQPVNDSPPTLFAGTQEGPLDARGSKTTEGPLNGRAPTGRKRGLQMEEGPLDERGPCK